MHIEGTSMSEQESERSFPLMKPSDGQKARLQLQVLCPESSSQWPYDRAYASTSNKVLELASNRLEKVLGDVSIF